MGSMEVFRYSAAEGGWDNDTVLVQENPIFCIYGLADGLEAGQ